MKKANGLPGRPKGSAATKTKSLPGRPPGACKICEHMRKNKNCDLNRQLVEGASARSIALEYGFNEKTVAKHRKNCLTKRLKSAANAREAKAGLDLLKCQEKVWNDAQEAIDLSLGRKEPPKHPYNLTVFGQCIAPQVKIIEVLAKVEGSNQNSNDTSLLDAIKASAKDAFANEDHTMGTIKPKATTDTEMVGTS